MSDLSIPLSGLNAAAARLDSAARRIVQAPAVAETAAAGPQTAPNTGRPLLADGTGPSAAVETALVDIIVAEQAYKANIQSLRTLAEVQDSLLEIES